MQSKSAGIVLATLVLLSLFIAAPAQAKHHKKTKKPKAVVVTYKGSGTIQDATEDDNGDASITVDFDSANKALKKVIGADLTGVDLSFNSNTAFSLDDDDQADILDSCADDQVDFVLKTKKKVTAKNLADFTATSVTVTSSEDNQDCSTFFDNENATEDDPSTDDPSVDDPSVDTGDDTGDSSTTDTSGA